MKKQIAVALFGLISGVVRLLPAKDAPPLLQPDKRFKADLLMIVAHPDDDTLLAGYFAKLTLDEHKKVAVIYCTAGSSGGNVMGYEAGSALGQMRIIEARRALATIGIENVWFLGARDTPGQDVLWSLDSWGHGRVLDEVVRLVRVTRPEVIVTWLPDYDVGENHGDHQAAGVVATEAFDAAGDPLRFPEQVAPPRDRQGMNNLTEGLLPWQPKKLYYQTDAFEYMNPYWHEMADRSPYRESMLDGTGPEYKMTDVSPSRHESYAKIFAGEQSIYGTQGGDIGVRALAKNDVREFEYPVHLIFGKSLVGGGVTDDVFAGVTDKPIAYVRAPGFEPGEKDETELELGGPWKFYREFWKAHGIDGVAKLIPVPEAAVKYGQELHIPVLITNHGTEARTVRLVADLPDGWSSKGVYDAYPVRAGETYPAEFILTAPDRSEHRWQEIAFKTEEGGRATGTAKMRIFLGKTGGLPQ